MFSRLGTGAGVVVGGANFEKTKIKTKTKTETKAGEPARGARSTPPVGSYTRSVSVFVFVLIFVFLNFEISKHIF